VHPADHALVEGGPFSACSAHQGAPSVEAWIDSHQSIGEEAIFGPGAIVASALLSVDSDSGDLDVAVLFLANSREIFERVLAPSGVSDSRASVCDNNELSTLVVSSIEKSWDKREHLSETGRLLVGLVTGNRDERADSIERLVVSNFVLLVLDERHFEEWHSDVQRIVESNDADTDVTSLDVVLVCEDGRYQLSSKGLHNRCFLLVDAIEVDGNDQVVLAADTVFEGLDFAIGAEVP